MKMKWSKIRNESFGDDRVSDATLNGEEVGRIRKYRYGEFARWETVCYHCDECIDYDSETVKEARGILEKHLPRCGGNA